MGYGARISIILAANVLLIASAGRKLSSQTQGQPIKRYDRERAAIMLSDAHEALRKSYYDPTFHGLDIDARYKTYKEKINASPTLAEAFRAVAAYLYGLDDSHTFFIPPRRTYRLNYEYRMEIIGENCYITDVRPGSDAAQKLHPGDQVVSLNGYSLNRKDLWQLEYYLRELAPEVTSRFTVRGPDGGSRTEIVNTPFVQKQHLSDLTFGSNDIWRLVFEAEQEQQLLRTRVVEHGDLMIWKMPIFRADPQEIDTLVSVAHRHKAVILDMRGNPGGRVDTLKYLVSKFFDRDIKIATKVTRKEQTSVDAKSSGKDAFKGKLIVLVDSRSGSAAEVFSRVVQLEHRGTVLGDRTAGAVMESQIYPFKAGIDVVVFYAFSITQANLVMADGKSLEKTGVLPDETILPTASDLVTGRDPVLARAAELAGVGLDPVVAGKMFPFEWAPL